MVDYVRVCAVDPGTRNYSFCVVDNTNWRLPLCWHHVDLWAPKVGRSRKPTVEDIVAVTHEWCAANDELLRSCDVIVIERQMRTPYIVMCSVIQALYFTRVRIVHPMTVGSFFGLPKTRDAKKAAGIATCKRFAVIPDARKLDDLADSWLTAVHTLVLRGGISELDLQ